MTFQSIRADLLFAFNKITKKQDIYYESNKYDRASATRDIGGTYNRARSVSRTFELTLLIDDAARLRKRLLTRNSGHGKLDKYDPSILMSFFQQIYD